MMKKQVIIIIQRLWRMTYSRRVFPLLYPISLVCFDGASRRADYKATVVQGSCCGIIQYAIRSISCDSLFGESYIGWVDIYLP